MNSILIEKYRGFDIEFNKSNNRFECRVTGDQIRKSSDFELIKKGIDSYIKDNEGFKPFWILRTKPSGDEQYRLRVTGIRKDGRLSVENEKGEKSHLSDWDLDKYYVEALLDISEYDSLAMVINTKRQLIQECDERISDKEKLLNPALLKTYIQNLES